MLKTANTYEELLALLTSEGIEIKHGAHLAMKLPIAERYVRTESIGEEYSEKMLRFYFDNRLGYNALKAQISTTKQEHLQTKRNYTDRYTSMRNIDVEIRMLNMLSEHNIKNIDDLQLKISHLEDTVTLCDNNISRMDEEIKSRQTVINAIQDYWHLKPILTEYKSIGDNKAKELFYVENIADIEKYSKVTEVLNENKLPDGTLPKVEQLRAEMAEYKRLKEMNYENRDKARKELEEYSILRYNIKELIKTNEQEVAR